MEESGIMARRGWCHWTKLVLFSVAITVVLSELGAWVVLKIRGGERYDTIALTKEQFLRRVPRPTSPDELAEELEAVGQNPVNLTRDLHPFFGFTFQRNLKSPWRANNAGFMSRYDYPYRKEAGELVLGVFGGSIAQGLGAPGPNNVLRRELAAAMAPRGYGKVTILMFAQGAWKQPQSAFCFLYYLDTFDLAIFLEGFNEIAGLPLDTGGWPQNYPWDFPMITVYRPLSKRLGTAEGIGLRMEISTLRDRQIRATRLAAWGLLGRSMLIHLVWRVVIDRLDNRVERLTARLVPEDSSYDGLFPDNASMEFKREEFFRRYRSFLEVVDIAARKRRKPAFFFLQPNQYVPGSKPLSDVERSAAYRPDWPDGKHVVAYYPRLREMWRRLGTDGVEAHDLSMMFEAVEEDLYTDPCCHLNERGLTLIAEKIAETVTRSPLVDLIPPAD